MSSAPPPPPNQPNAPQGQPPHPGAPGQPQGQYPPGGPQGYSPYPPYPPPQRSGLPTWAIVLIVIGAVCFVLVPLLIGILLPALGAARRTANRMKNNTQVRSVVQKLTVYASVTDDAFPSGSTLERFQILVDDQSDPLDPMILINPVGHDQSAAGMNLDARNVSYALLNDESPEWANNTNASAPIVADKQLSGGESFWSDPWSGSVGWGDSHASFEPDQTVPFKLDDLIVDPHDLFNAASPNEMENP